jgi:hypothetical protein
MMLVLGVSTLGMVPYVAIALSQFSVRSLVLVLVVVVCGVWLVSTSSSVPIETRNFR